LALSAALPDAVLRMPRTTAGRRALQVGLLVGGLFVLGLLCGEQARAADGVAPTSKPTDVVRSVTSSVERLAKGPEEAGQRIGERPSGSGSGSEQPGLPKAITPVTDEVQRVVRPVSRSPGAS
jgi:hypothetical protein